MKTGRKPVQVQCSPASRLLLLIGRRRLQHLPYHPLYLPQSMMGGVWSQLLQQEVTDLRGRGGDEDEQVSTEEEEEGGGGGGEEEEEEDCFTFTVRPLSC